MPNYMGRGIEALFNYTENLKPQNPQDERLKALKIQEMEQGIAAHPENLNWLRTQRNIFGERAGREKEIYEYEKSLRIGKELMGDLTDADSMSDIVFKVAGKTTWETYPQVRQWASEIGSKTKYGSMIEKALPPVEWFEGMAQKSGVDTPTFFKAWRNSELRKMKPESEEIEYKQDETGAWVALPKRVKAGEIPTGRPTGVKGKLESKTSTHYETDDLGNTTKITTDSTGATIRTEPMGRIGKSREPRGGEEAKVSKLGMVKKNLDEDYAQMMGEDVGNLPKKMSPEQRRAYQDILSRAERYATTMLPRDAVNAALRDYERANKPKVTTSETSGMDKSIQDAVEAIEAGAPEEAVRKRFREKYKKELPLLKW